ncbi:hypothetical protein FPV67DRAFT_201113 [Lyophyllum atratum]|nr:hypothetical protein FPV67DRAFT_201113 [Lyophyllum atratum]
MAKSYDSDTDASSSEESEHHSEDDYVQKSQKAGVKRKRGNNSNTRRLKPKVAPKLPYVARVTATATNEADMLENASKVDRADSNILARIRKAMKLATHPGTGEAEAKVAMRMATKLMQSQNLTQADLIANETAEERSTRAGQSTVTITSTNNKSVRRQRWYGFASSAACEAFDVQVYSESYEKSLDWVFYGLADNTVAAALAFEMLHNQIENWAIERKGDLKGRSAGTSYRSGVAQRVWQDAEKENKKAVKKAEEEEKKRLAEEAAAAEVARAAEIARLAAPIVPEAVATSPVEEKGRFSVKIEDVPDEDEAKPSRLPEHEEVKPLGLRDMDDHRDDGDDDDSDNDQAPPHYDEGANMSDDDMRADFDEQDGDAGHLLDLDALERKVQIKSEPEEPLQIARRCSPLVVVKPEPEAANLEIPTIKSEPSDDAPSWNSALQLRTFRDNAKTIAETYLKDTGLKIRKGPKMRAMKHDQAAFNKGWDDGQKVDLKRRRIEGEENIKEEK